MKVSLEQIEATLLERQIEPPKVQEIIKDLEQALEEEKAERDANKVPKAKWEYLIVINDPEKKLGTEFTGWVVKQLEGQDSGLMLGKLTDAAKTQNESSKRKKSLITGFGELFSALKTKFLKEKGLKICTKEAVRVLTVNGKTL
jgi:signal recognition particle GTPase